MSDVRKSLRLSVSRPSPIILAVRLSLAARTVNKVKVVGKAKPYCKSDARADDLTTLDYPVEQATGFTRFTLEAKKNAAQ